MFYYIDSIINTFSTTMYYVIVGLIYFLYIVTLVGITYVNPEYSNTLTVILQTFIALVLMVRFNPLRKNVYYTTNDQTFIFASSVFLLSNNPLAYYIKHWFYPVTSKLDSL